MGRKRNLTTAEFWESKVGSHYIPEPNTGCWLWTKNLGRGGYAQAKIHFLTRNAARVFYEAFRGPIPDGLQLDHLCRQRSCVNPEHLEAVTARVNTLRSRAPSALNARKTHCPAGHPFDEKNTGYADAKHTMRRCLKCHASRQRAYMARKRANVRDFC